MKNNEMTPQERENLIESIIDDLIALSSKCEVKKRETTMTPEERAALNEELADRLCNLFAKKGGAA